MSHQLPPDDLARVEALCEEHAVRTVECVVVDTWGIPRGKRVPVRQFLRGGGFHIANVLYTWDPACGIFPTPWVDEKDGFPDMHAVPDLASFRIAGWADGVATVMCDTYDAGTGQPVVLDSRGMLKRTIAEFGQLGLAPMAAAELEFYLVGPDGGPLYRDIDCYSIRRGGELEPFLGEVRDALTRSGIEVEASNTEYGVSQIEINLRYTDALATADATVLFKYVVRELARRAGHRVTFMAKPFAGEPGNGMHVHQSLAVIDGGGERANVFAERDVAGPVGSSLMRRYLAGLLAHHKELQLVMTPTLNGYRRVEDYSFSPTQVTWGLDHRLVGVRCIADQGPGNRLEARWAAADANPYLVLHGCLQAGLHGLREDLPLLDMVVGDPHVDERWERLPTSLADALAVWEKSDFARQVYGDTFVDVFAVMQRHELDAYAGHVSDWERQRYGDVL